MSTYTESEQLEFELPTWSALPARPHKEFDQLARTLAEELRLPLALVILVSKGGRVFPGAVGLSPLLEARRSGPLEHSLSRYVAATGNSLLIRDALDDPKLRDNPALAEQGLRTYAGVPLLDARGHPLGVLCAGDRQPRDWSPADLAVLHRLADQCSRLLQVHGLELAERESLAAAERESSAARLAADAAQAAFEQAEAAADHARLVARLSNALLAAGSLGDVLRTVDRLVRSPLGAAAAVLGIVAAGSSDVQTWTTTPVLRGRRPTAPLHLDDAHPLAAAVRDRQLVTVATREAGERLFPTRRELPDPSHESAAAIPLLLGQHASSGALLVSWRERREVDPALGTVVADLARHVGHALDRVLLADQRQRLEQQAPEPPAG